MSYGAAVRVTKRVCMFILFIATLRLNISRSREMEKDQEVSESGDSPNEDEPAEGAAHQLRDFLERESHGERALYGRVVSIFHSDQSLEVPGPPVWPSLSPSLGMSQQAGPSGLHLSPPSAGLGGLPLPFSPTHPLPFSPTHPQSSHQPPTGHHQVFCCWCIK